MHLRHFSSSDVVTSPEEYMTRGDHLRVLESRLAQKETELMGESSRKLQAVERDWKWRMEAKETEVTKAADARVHQVGGMRNGLWLGG